MEFACERCKKAPSLCVCQAIQPHTTHHHVLILQHPQEPDHEIGSALLTHLALPNSTLKIGLSWRNLAAALDKPEASSAEWAVLYLGSGVKGEIPKNQALQFVSKNGAPIERPPKLQGVVLLDGTWSQAKALWWRNPWLLKLKRAILQPQEPSLYRDLRKEPRKECLSTIESAAEVLLALGEKPEVSGHLKEIFKQLLTQYRQKR
jgi:DTW domain-containing protein